MKKIKLCYFLPENEKELEELVGKTVGIKIVSNNNVWPMVYSGIFNGEHEFLQQAFENGGKEVFLNRIWGWRNQVRGHLKIVFREYPYNGEIILCRCCRDIKSYFPGSEEYYQRLDYLKQNDLWMES